jgi:LCP family protein required for cell wall assembly
MNPKRTCLLLPVLLLLMSLIACQVSTRTATPDPGTLATMVAGTLTALTPTVPLPTVPLPTETPGITPTPADTSIPDAGAGYPPAAEAIVQPAGQTTLILLGSDQRPNHGDFRTDIMLVVVLRPDGSVNLVSLPRDLWVFLPGRSMQRINTAQEFGGFSLLQDTFQYNFGFAPQSYVLTNFSGFQAIVDSLGGIDVYASQNYHEARDGYFPGGYTIKAGWVHMDGETALWYVRGRELTGDLDRLRRSQEVVVGLGRRLLSANGLTRAPQFYAALRNMVVTDLTLDNVVALLPQLGKIDPAKIHYFQIGESQVTPTILPASGASVLLPNPDAIRQVLQEALSSQ